MVQTDPAFHDSAQHLALRQALVASMARKGIAAERVLRALLAVPRHFFVPAGTPPEAAYADKALAIGEGQTVSQPYTVAYQTSLLDLQDGQRVLEVGTGSGYQAAILQQWAIHLDTIECNPRLYAQARERLRALGCGATVHHGDGSAGLPEHAPFDRILVTAGAPAVPLLLCRQLGIGGQMVIPVGEPKKQNMLRITRNAMQQFDTETFDSFSFVPLLGAYGWK